MESKTKHRILGIIVIAGLAVLMYPMMQKSGNLPDEQTLVKAPPFPDQAIQVSSSDTDVAPTVPQDPATNGSSNQGQPDASIDEQPHGAIPGDQAVIINIQPPSLVKPTEIPENATATAEEENAKDLTDDDDSEDLAVKKLDKDVAVNNAGANSKSKLTTHKKTAKAKKVVKPTVHSKLTSRSMIAAYKQVPVNDNGLIRLKKAAWVIQLGSFKNKTNALRLVNKLRSNGYRAFIQKYATSTGDHTRVFVGPEHQQKSARYVAAELDRELKLHGIVISYKPFTL